MLKYLSFHNSSFALRYFLNVNGKGHSVTHTWLLLLLAIPSEVETRDMMMQPMNRPKFGIPTVFWDHLESIHMHVTTC